MRNMRARMIMAAFLWVAIPSSGWTDLPPTPSPSSVAAPVADDSLPNVTSKEGRRLLKDFRKSLALETKELKSSQSRIRKDAAASRKARLKDWDLTEREARRAYFAREPRGKERRAYMKDYLARRSALESSLKAEEKQLKDEQDARRKALFQDQQTRLVEFQRYLKSSKRPPETLWPRIAAD